MHCSYFSLFIMMYQKPPFASFKLTLIICLFTADYEKSVAFIFLLCIGLSCTVMLRVNLSCVWVNLSLFFFSHYSIDSSLKIQNSINNIVINEFMRILIKHLYELELELELSQHTLCMFIMLISSLVVNEPNCIFHWNIRLYTYKQI